MKYMVIIAFGALLFVVLYEFLEEYISDKDAENW